MPQGSKEIIVVVNSCDYLGHTLVKNMYIFVKMSLVNICKKYLKLFKEFNEF